jgi:hypothetical protein
MVMNAISHTFSLNTSMTIILLCTNKIKQEETIEVALALRADRFEMKQEFLGF